MKRKQYMIERLVYYLNNNIIMKRKNYIGYIVTFFMLVLVSCAGVEEPEEEIQHLNISVYIDLSDRIDNEKKFLSPSQMSRDTAIINYLADYLKEETIGPNILKSKNSMRIFFYPAPKDENISALSRKLVVDVAKKQGRDKRIAVENMKQNFDTTLAYIYDKTIHANDWPGADIWDFFNSGAVDDYCIKENARNILVILTDGELYHKDNKDTHPIKKDGKNGYNYILSDVIRDPKAYLRTDREGKLSGKGLEVLMLEINPDPQKKGKIRQLIGDWFESMGIEKYRIYETNPAFSSTEMRIEKFLDNSN